MIPRADTAAVSALVDHIFRRWYARISSTLLRGAGTAHIDLVEDAVQEALLSALQHWPYRGIPEQPDAWLYQVARRKLLDRIARQSTATRAQQQVAVQFAENISPQNSGTGADILDDDELTMLFLCAHPSLNTDAQVTLMLRTVCGLIVPEIASASLVPDSTIAQRIVRAKRILAAESAPFELPNAGALADRLDVVLQAIYLMFTEGYAARSGDAPVRRELCREAIRLVTALAHTSMGAAPRTFALCALLELQSSRLEARDRADGTTVPFAQQDRSLWNRAAIARGLHWLSRAADGNTISDYHLQAAIAAEHAVTLHGAATNWHRIRHYYEQMLTRTTSPIVRLNHALAVARTDGPNAGLALLAALDTEPRLAGNHLLPAMRAVLYQESGQVAEAADSTRVALQRARNLADQSLLAARLAELAPENTGAFEQSATVNEQTQNTN